MLIFAARGIWSKRQAAVDAPGPDVPTAARTPETFQAAPERATPAVSRPRPKRIKPVEAETASTTPDPPAVDWAKVIDAVLTADLEPIEKAQRILGVLPQLPEDEQLEAAEHLSNLLPDEHYLAAAGPILTNAQTSTSLFEVLLTDLLARPEAIKLPMMSQIARIPGHPQAEEARDILEAYLENDFGADWNAWDEAIAAWLKENPE